MTPASPGAALREIFERPETVLMPAGALPIHAQMAERAGFQSFYLSGAFFARWVEGVPDAGWVTLTEVVTHARRVARGVDIPIFCDAETGFGAPINVERTVEEFIHAGVGGIHIEDQREPKKSGGVTGIELVSDAEALGRLNAACDTRDRLDSDFLIIARTDGYGAAGGSLEEAIRRGQLYRAETGVDGIFYEGFDTWEQAELALRETPGRGNYVIPRAGPVIGQRTLAELTVMGQAIETLHFAVTALREAWRMLVDIKAAGDGSPFAKYLEGMKETEGTVYDIGWGRDFARPSEAYVTSTEKNYLPANMQRDYVNTQNAKLAPASSLASER